MKKIVLWLTSNHGGIQRPIMIVTDCANVRPTTKDHNSRVEPTGCTVDDGMHNNGGHRVMETFDEVTKMIADQLEAQGH